MNNVVSLKIMENIITHRDVKIVKTERKRDYLVSEPNHHTTQFFTEKLLAKEKKKKQNTYEWTCLSRELNAKRKTNKDKLFRKILQKILKLDLILQIVN